MLFDGTESSVLAFGFLMKLEDGRDKKLKVEFLNINVWKKILVGGHKLYGKFSRLFLIDDRPNINGVGNDTPKSAGFTFDAFDGIVYDFVSDL